MRRLLCLIVLAACAASAQVYSPKVLIEGQPDPTDLKALASGIYAQAHAKTPRERAEAIWRFFNTDGRFVKPGFWYHIAGWAYEEPMGEVLDPVKLLNSYGYGLCYQIAPLLEAVFKAGGFEDARVWFLTGHTVTEVFYDGGYHYFDSDMMGYNPVGKGPLKQRRVASVHDLEQDGNIILSKVERPGDVDNPWYPADVRDGAMGGLAELFTTTKDNWLYAFQRYPAGHTMDFVLRPGERLIRYFEPQGAGAYYLPYKSDGKQWSEFPNEIREYNIRTTDGPHSQKDKRRWGTGIIEYRPRLDGRKVWEVRSPYVIIDGAFEFDAVLAAAQTLAVETSTDDGRTWVAADTLRGPHKGSWKCEPGVPTTSAHGRRTAVSGTYGYLVRVATEGEVRGVTLSTRIQVNPRSLPVLQSGRNELVYTAGPRVVRRSLSAVPEKTVNARWVEEGGQGFWAPSGAGPAEFLFKLAAADLSGFDAGGRFLDLRAGLAPDKFTAEVRKVSPALVPAHDPAASIAWSTSPDGPFRALWDYDPTLRWKDNQPIDRTLCWPEVDRPVAALPAGTQAVYVRYRVEGMAVDQFRLATVAGAPAGPGPLLVTHVWREKGVEKRHAEEIPAGAANRRYTVAAGKGVANEAVIFESPLQ
jgi:hypothetical protein